MHYTSLDFVLPVEQTLESVDLPPHLLDVLLRPFSRRDASLHRRVLRRQAERIPAQGLKDLRITNTLRSNVVAAHPFVTGDAVGKGVPVDYANHRANEHSDMTHVRLSGRVREHRQYVEIWLPLLCCSKCTNPSPPTSLNNRRQSSADSIQHLASDAASQLSREWGLWDPSNLNW